MRTVGVIINKGGGSAVEPNVQAVREVLQRRHADFELVVTEPDHIKTTARRMIGEGREVVAIGGGDGSINAVAAEVASSNAILGVLPLGTLNHFAKDLGVPLNPGEAAKLLVQDKTREVDFATVNGKIFLNNSGIGLYPSLVRRREIEEPNVGKWPAAVLAAIRLLIGPFRCLDLEVECDGKKQRISTTFIFVGNNDYRIDAQGLSNRDYLDNGQLVLYAHPGKSRWRLIWNGLQTLVGLSGHLNWVKFSGQSIKISGPGASMDVSVDGEIHSLTMPLEYQIHPRGLEVAAE